MSKGKLVRVEIRPGQYVKMYEADARARGLIGAPEKKQRPKPLDKMREQPQDKGAETPAEEPEPEEKAVFDDLTTIPGVGPATARALEMHGIVTFDDLAAAEDLDYLPPMVLAAIAEWRVSWLADIEGLEGDELG